MQKNVFNLGLKVKSTFGIQKYKKAPLKARLSFVNSIVKS